MAQERFLGLFRAIAEVASLSTPRDLTPRLGRTVWVGRSIALYAAVSVAVAALVQVAAPAANNASERDGVDFRVPTGWFLTRGQINAVADPVTIFTVSTFRLRPIATSPSGVCSARVQRAWRPDGGYVQLTEERDGASRARMMRRVPRRPRHFVLDARGRGGLCTPPDSGGFAFQEHGRAFYIFYGFGRAAPKAVRAQAQALLDGMRIFRRR